MAGILSVVRISTLDVHLKSPKHQILDDFSDDIISSQACTNSTTLDRVIHAPTISNRHCLFFSETKAGNDVAVVEDLSGNGTFVNEAIVGRNKRRELREGDEIAILDSARFIFRYPRNRNHHGFNQQYAIQTQLGKGHFATVYLCVEKCSGMKFAVKKFEKRTGPGERSKVEGLQQEIGVLKGVSHPNLLCLKDVFDEGDGVYLVLELAVEGELFNWIVMKQKLSEAESRKLFIQIFQSLKYLVSPPRRRAVTRFEATCVLTTYSQHDRNIVHRDIKPENILLVDRDLSVKLADFGLAKIIGEESFTTTLCGTPSYVAPEILESSNHRRYTKAVDVWSAGVVLYICLCGFPPFSDELYSAENPYTLSQQIKLGRFDYPSPYWDPVSDLALDLIDRMLTVDVERRISIDDCLEHPWLTNSSEGDLTTHNGASGLNTQSSTISATDSTDGLASAITKLDFSKRKLPRERTLISSIHDVKIVQTVPIDPSQAQAPIKIFAKNENESDKAVKNKKDKSADQAQKGAKGNEKENSKQQKKVQKRTEDAREMQAKAGAKGGVKAQSAGKALQNGKKPKNAGAKEATPAEERDPEVFAKMGGNGDEPLFGGR